MMTALASGVLLGFSAGLSPGPVLALFALLLFREGLRQLAVI
jgi:hypothetical protein